MNTCFILAFLRKNHKIRMLKYKSRLYKNKDRRMTKETEKLHVKIGYSHAKDEAEAIAEFVGMVDQPGTNIIVFFVSSDYDLMRLEKELKGRFKSPVIGCTTAGEISPMGYSQGGITGFSLASEELEVFSVMIPSLQTFDGKKTKGLVQSIQDKLEQAMKRSPEAGAFGLLFIDGLSIMEEQVTAILANAVEPVPIAGGSAGDDFKLKKTYVYSEGSFVSDAALITFFVTTLPFIPIKTQHFSATEKRLVITRASPEKRIVHEINGLPAAEEYARVVDLDVKDLTPLVFSECPVMLRFGGEYYVRSIQKVNDDGSLTFFCAIDEGLVLRVAAGENLVNNLDEALMNIRKEIPNIKLTIGFDCILRLLEVQNKKLQDGINPIFKRDRVIGFNTYGEQFNSVHVNQTFTGIVLGE